MATTDNEVKELIKREYEHGFVTEIESDTFEPGLNEDVIRRLSEIKQEPEFMLEWRLKAYRRWLEMDEPEWAHVDFPKVDYDSISYYSAPKKKKTCPRAWTTLIRSCCAPTKNWASPARTGQAGRRCG